ncbi:MAG: BamA/TamA family outer membrane protein [Vampirovibrionales bacterium]|nr:BamA/TamA family outer membrane protein [Vampirovibrionales bacterium]
MDMTPHLDALKAFRLNKRLMLSLSLALSLGAAVSTAPVFSQALDTADDTDASAPQAGEPTPLSDFAPDEVRPARDKRYDQGLTITKVTIDGNRLVQSEAIKDVMAIRPGALYNKGNLQGDLKRIYDMGYFTDKIRAVPIATNNGILLKIEVEENAPVTGVNIQGNTLITDSELQGVFAGQTGMPQNVGQLNESVQKIEQLYASKGYVLARVKGLVDDPDGVINLNITEGKINDIRFVGNRKTKQFVLDRMLTTKKGAVYNEKVVSEDLKRLFSTQSFSDVRRVLTASPDDPEQYDLTIELDEKKTGAISVGGGLDTGTGVFGSVGYNDPNFLGRGQNFSSMAAVGTGIIGRGDSLASARTYQFDVSWSSPSLFNSSNALEVAAYGRDMASVNIPLGIERRIGTGVTWSRPLKSLDHMAMSLGLGGERVSLREGGDNSSLDDLGILRSARSGQLEGGTFLSVTPTLAYDSRNNRFNPTQGMLNTLSMTGAYGLSGASYGTVSTNLRKYFKLREGVTLALNAQGGSNLIGDIPEFNMFRVGGSYSVRGFREGGLGIGNGFLLGSAEVRSKVPLFGPLKKVPFLETLSTALFVDGGRVLDQADLISSGDFAQKGFGASVGAGLRINLPGLGPIRVDYAIPIAGGTSKYTQRFNFGIGQKF